jgi:predicted esterase
MQYKSYLQLDKKVDRLFAEKRYDEGITLLESARTLFPDRLPEILLYESIIHVYNEDKNRCLDSIKESLEKGFFMDLEWNVFDPVRDNEEFKAAFESNLRLRTDFQAQAKMTYQVLHPETYSPGRRHPLFIACHGNMSAIEGFKERWEPAPMLAQGFVVVYIQSSQVICTNGFNWTDSWKKTREEIKACYDEVVEQESIHTDKVVVGGYSGGGIAAIEVTMANIFPIKGFITLCSSRKPESFTRDAVESAKRRGVKGVLMHGELEEAPEEREMITVFDEKGFPYRLVNNPGIGHNFPEDFSLKLSESIEFVMC